MLDLDQAIRERHSTRMFLSQPVPRELVNEALALAQDAPSNSNIQPWHMVFASGAVRNRLVAALLDEAKRRPPHIPPLPASFQHFRSELGAQVYGAMGIAREDTARHPAAVLRNWEFFRAPLAGIVCMHRDLGPADALSVGMFLQTLLLALSERGLGSCVEVSIAGYPEIVRAQLAIPTELSILCGLAVGYPDPDFPANKLHIGREPIKENVPRKLIRRNEGIIPIKIAPFCGMKASGVGREGSKYGIEESLDGKYSVWAVSTARFSWRARGRGISLPGWAGAPRRTDCHLAVRLG